MARHYPEVLSTTREQLPHGAKILAAVSGGLDSVVLLHALSLLRDSLNLTVEVAHVDHALREASPLTLQFVEDLTRTRYQYPFHYTRLLPPAERSNIEAWGRGMRYEFLSRIRVERGLDWILTAHHADDCVETLLMRLVTGKELKGIAGKDESRRLIRPLRAIAKSSLADFAKEHNLAWHEDESNQDVSLLRNRIRHRLVPFLLNEFGEREIEIIARRAEYQNSDSDLLEQLAINALSGMRLEELEDAKAFSKFREQISALHDALKWRVLAELMLPAIGYRLGREHCVSAAQVIEGTIRGCQFPGGWSLLRSKGRLFIRQPSGKL